MTSQLWSPIGTPGQRWGAAETSTWLSRQLVRRSFAEEVLRAIESLQGQFDVSPYGQLEYASGAYPLVALRSRGWREDLPIVLVTGGVHGYETSGVHGALQFAQTRA
ncbi:MAG: peptidase, partial [Rhodanobacter sp.]